MVSPLVAGMATGVVQAMDARDRAEAQQAKLDFEAAQAEKTRTFQATQNQLTRDAQLEQSKNMLKSQQNTRKITIGLATSQKIDKSIAVTGKPFPLSELSAAEVEALNLIGRIPQNGMFTSASSMRQFNHKTLGPITTDISQGKSSLADMPKESVDQMVMYYSQRNNISPENARRVLTRGSAIHSEGLITKAMLDHRRFNPSVMAEPVVLHKGGYKKFIEAFPVTLDTNNPHLDIIHADIGIAEEKDAKAAAQSDAVRTYAMFKRLNDRILQARQNGRQDVVDAYKQYFLNRWKSKWDSFINRFNKDGATAFSIPFGGGSKIFINFHKNSATTGNFNELHAIANSKPNRNFNRHISTDTKAKSIGVDKKKYLQLKATGNIKETTKNENDPTKATITKIDVESLDHENEEGILYVNNGEDVVPNPEYFKTVKKVRKLGMLDLNREYRPEMFSSENQNRQFAMAKETGLYSSLNKATQEMRQSGVLTMETYRNVYDKIKTFMGEGVEDDKVFRAVQGIIKQRVLFQLQNPKDSDYGSGLSPNIYKFDLRRRGEEDLTNSEKKQREEAQSLAVKIQDFRSSQNRFNTIRGQIGLITESVNEYNVLKKRTNISPSDIRLARRKISNILTQIYNDPESPVIALLGQKGRSAEADKTRINEIVRDLEAVGTQSEDRFTETISNAFQFFKDAMNATDFGAKMLKWGAYARNAAGGIIANPYDYASTLKIVDRKNVAGSRYRLRQLTSFAATSEKHARDTLENAQQQINDAQTAEEKLLARTNYMKAYLIARRSMLKVAMTYTFAGMLQGESGGRSISNEDFQIIFDALWSTKGGAIAEGKFSEFVMHVDMIQNRVRAEQDYIGFGTKENPATHLPTTMSALSRVRDRQLVLRKFRTGVTASLNQKGPSPAGGSSIPVLKSIVRLSGKTSDNRTYSLSSTSGDTNARAKFQDLAGPAQTELFSGTVDALRRTKVNLKIPNNKKYDDLSNEQKRVIRQAVINSFGEVATKAKNEKSLERFAKAAKWKDNTSLYEYIDSWAKASKNKKYYGTLIRQPRHLNFMEDFIREMYSSIRINIDS